MRARFGLVFIIIFCLSGIYGKILGNQSGPIADFQLSAYFLQKAGVPFPLRVENARDSNGNPASGIVEILVEAGDGVSPYGYPPVLVPIQVVNGTGEADQILTKAVSTALIGKAGEVSRRAEPILVLPGELDTFELNIFSPQTSGHPFTSPSTVTAKDSLGNDKVDFDASLDFVVIKSNVIYPAKLENNILMNSNDFILGIADLAKLGTTYTGRGTEIVFKAGSQSGRLGFSNSVLMRNINFNSASASQDTLNPNDTLQITVSLYNVSNVSSVLESLQLFSKLPLSFELVQGSLPESLRAFDSMAFMFQTIIPENLINKIVKVGGELKGKIEGLEVSESVENLVSFLVIPESPPKISYVAGSLSPQTVSAGGTYGFQLTLKNESNFSLTLSDSTLFQFTSFQSNLTESITITENDTARLSFSPALIDSALMEGKYPVTLQLKGLKDNQSFQTSLELSDSVTVQRITLPPELIVLMTTEKDTLRKGPNSGVIKIRLTNQSRQTGHSIKLEKISFSFLKDDQILNAGEVVSSSDLRNENNMGEIISVGVPNEQSGELDFIPLEIFVIEPDSDEFLAMSLNLREDFAGTDFDISSTANQILALDFSDNQTGERVRVLSASGQDFSFKKKFYLSTVQPVEFLLNYPNPFEPGKEVTNFVFDLPQPSDLTLKIYTLSGELVNDFEIPAGTTVFAWDGRNGEGRVIQSGVYLAWLKIKNSGQEVKTKVAAVR